MNNNMSDVEKIDIEFDILWETIKTDQSFFTNQKTGQTLKVIVEDGEEKLIVNRRKGKDHTGKAKFDNDPSLKSTIRERFFFHRTKKFSDGSVPDEKYKKNISVYEAIFNRYDNNINKPVYTISYVYNLRKSLAEIKKIASNNF